MEGDAKQLQTDGNKTYLKNSKSDSVISKGIPLPRCDSQVMLYNIHLSLE